MHKSIALVRDLLSRFGIVPTLLAASLLAVVTAVVVVQGWTLHIVAQSAEHTAQLQLDIDLGVLKEELQHRGTNWRLADDGRLMLDGEAAEGLDKVVDAVGRITHAVATVFAGDTRLATTVTRPDGSRAVGTNWPPARHATPLSAMATPTVAPPTFWVFRTLPSMSRCAMRLDGRSASCSLACRAPPSRLC